MSGDVLVVTSGKGGVGKTTTAVNLAIALRQRGHSVAVLDADLGMPNVASFLGLDAEMTLHDVLAGRATTAAATVEIDEGLGFVVGDRSLAGFADADPAGLNDVVAELADRYQYVLVDTGGGLTYEGVYPMELANGILLVTSPVPAAIADTKKSKQVADRLGIPIRGVVVTHTSDEDSPESIASELDVDFLGSVPWDEAVTESTTKRQPLVAYAPESRSTAAYYRIAERLSTPKTAGLDPLDTAPPPSTTADESATDETTEPDTERATDSDQSKTDERPDGDMEETDGSDSEDDAGAETPDGEGDTDGEGDIDQKGDTDKEGDTGEAGNTGQKSDTGQKDEPREDSEPSDTDADPTDTNDEDGQSAEAGDSAPETEAASTDDSEPSDDAEGGSTTGPDAEPGFFSRLLSRFR